MERTGLVPGVHMRHCDGGVSGPLHPLHLPGPGSGVGTVGAKEGLFRKAFLGVMSKKSGMLLEILLHFPCILIQDGLPISIEPHPAVLLPVTCRPDQICTS